MMVFARHDTTYWSQKRPSNGRDGNYRDGDKLLCNRCPLKHEAQKRERGEMLYENMPTENTTIGKLAERSTIDVSDT